jgi:ribosomal RNA-processing protein 12
MEDMGGTSDELCNSILSRFGNSTNEDHQHLCTVIGAMSQEFKDQNLPSTPVAYFGAACSSLDRLASEPQQPVHVVQSLLSILHIVLPRIPLAILHKKAEFLSDLLLRVLQSPLLLVDATTFGLKCVSHLLIIRDAPDWSEVSRLYDVLLGFLTDSRPKVIYKIIISSHCFRYNL